MESKSMHICEAIEQDKVVAREKIMTGISAVDTLMCGIYTGEVTSILGCSGSGKTSLLLAIANELAVENGLPVLYYQMFGTYNRLFDRLLSYACNLPLSDVAYDPLDSEQMNVVKVYEEKLKRAPFYLGKREQANISDIRYALSSFKEQGTPIKVLIIDDIFAFGYDKEERRFGYNLHQIAEEFNCAIVVAVETFQPYEREGLYGLMAQLRDCYEPGLDTYSDVVIGMINYDELEIYQDDEERDLHGVVELRLLKKFGAHNKPRVRVYKSMLASKDKILDKIPASLQPIVQGLNLEPVSELIK